MSAKCDRCGVESNLDATFFKARKSFSRSIQTYCPGCWLKRHDSTAKELALFNVGLGGLGLLLWLTLPETGGGPILINLFFFQLFLVLTILPHELGHAGMAHLPGMRVFKIYIGSGGTLFTFKLFGFECEFRPVPTGGLVVAAHRNHKFLRSKQFAFVLAGPVVNVFLATEIWPFLNLDQLWSLRPMENGWQPGMVFFYANLAVLLENLLPYNMATAFGPLPSDGKLLFQAFLLPREKRELYHAANFVMETAVCHQQADYTGARRWVEEGLALYPDNATLLNWHGVIALELWEYGKARECFLNLLHRNSKEPLVRPLVLNNIAYTNALLGGDDLLKEADALSHEAMAAMDWLPSIRGTRGTVLVAMGRFEEGLPLLHEAMSQAASPNHKAQNACLIAEAESRRGNLSAARTWLAEARKLDPRCPLLPRVESILHECSPIRTHLTI